MGNQVCGFCFGIEGSGAVNERTPLMENAELVSQIRTPSANTLYMPPKKFTSRYELRGVLGAGATGLCHVCLDIRTMNAFACKIVRKRRLLAERKHKVLKQLLIEVDVLKRLEHKNIVKFQDVFEDRNNLFIVMELVGGGELFAQVVRVGSFSEKLAAGIMRDVAAGLAYCHKMGVIHRDLKPENLLVPGPGLRPVKICDFGLAFQYSANRRAPRTFVGSPRYMAPEQMQRRPYNEKVDTWALGVILFILLSGCLPFEPAVLKRGEDQKLPVKKLALKFSGRRWKGISDEAKYLIHGCLVIDPDMRYSADQVLTHSWLNGKAPANLIQNSDHLYRYMLDKRSNGSFFLEPNTLGCKDVKTKMAATHRNKRSHPMPLNRGYKTPDGSPSSSPDSNFSKSNGSVRKSPSMSPKSCLTVFHKQMHHRQIIMNSRFHKKNKNSSIERSNGSDLSLRPPGALSLHSNGTGSQATNEDQERNDSAHTVPGTEPQSSHSAKDRRWACNAPTGKLRSL